MSKSTRADMSRREAITQRALELLLVSTPVKEIHKILEAEFGIHDYKHVYHYITNARKRLFEVNNTKIEYKLAEALKRLDKLYSQAFKSQKYGVCLQIQMEINKLNSLYQVQSETVKTPSITIVKDVSNG